MWWGEPREEGVRCHAVEISPNVSSGVKKGPVHTARFQEDRVRGPWTIAQSLFGGREPLW